MRRIPYDEAVRTMARALAPHLNEKNAAHLAAIFTQNSLEGVYSHGINRFPRFLRALESGSTDARVTTPKKVSGLGGLEVWDARFGVGPLIAEASMARAIDLAKTQGIGCVALRHNNHWLRAGRYGLQAAEAGMIGILFTNTSPNMVAWGAKEARTGNNPLVIAVPHKKGTVLLDMAASQFSYGKLEVTRLAGKRLPIDGGYDIEGRLTRDPGAIMQSMRMLPAGFWKGSALSTLLDLVAAAASLGRTSCVIASDPGDERGMSQVYIALNFRAVVDADDADTLVDQAIDYLTSSEPADPASPVRYPGQNLSAIRAENMRQGIPVDDSTWDAILASSGA